MIPLREKIGYALGDAASGGITWKIMSVAFPLFFTNGCAHAARAYV